MDRKPLFRGGSNGEAGGSQAPLQSMQWRSPFEPLKFFLKKEEEEVGKKRNEEGRRKERKKQAPSSFHHTLHPPTIEN